ncbi:cupin domain-containing protein [Roseovarius nanhaiticus]|uniref:cupin domain-containing protein n=1 Tax=Roseovarius nanhaiticus TaxID=573024 RepID=UPI00249053FF|nr:cupin domain-containing protein [Roseovarius nanhaiticus]
MIGYAPGQDVGPLEEWPLDNPASDYVIQRGAPRTYGRIDAGGPGHETRFGIWHCTAGAFDCTEQGDELMTILEGACRLTEHATGETRDLAAGDSLFVRDGSRVTWDVAESVTKVFLGHKPDGY